MALAFRSREIGVKDTSHAANVPDNPKARLMYYVGCVEGVLKSSTEHVGPKYMDYNNYYLSDDETRTLISFCETFSPSFLEDKCFFRSPELCQGKPNRFLELSSKELTFATARSVVVMGKEAFVAKIMVYNDTWRRYYYDDPLYEVKRSLRPPSPTYTTRRRSNSCIII
ncbi:Hypothetical predicted protein [Paramuricea clavata]|uniref:Uncharacterized protein n=1 Tax=Paramuricea clavata TaxID=317549 RepID=A0A7D9HGP1_PARCT|nr:Hypothetical predicted protein [Paramuricea clavata]